MDELNEMTSTGSIPSEPVVKLKKNPMIARMHYCEKCNSVFWEDICEGCKKDNN